MSHVPRILALLAFPLVLACGARSSLPIGESGRGTSSSSAGGGVGGTGGTGGMGGAPILSCGAVQLASPLLMVSAPGAQDSTQPSLAQLLGTPPLVALIYTSQVATDPKGGRIASFDAWGAWPPSPLKPTAIKDGTSPLFVTGLLAASHRDPNAPSAFSMIEVIYPGDFAYFMGSISLGPPQQWSNVPMRKGAPLSLAPDASGLDAFAAVAYADGPYFALDVADMQGDVLSSAWGSYLPAIGCAATPVAADAVGAGPGWLFGAALGTDLAWTVHPEQPCDTYFQSIGPATRLHFAAIPFGPAPEAKLGTTLEAAAAVDRLRLAARSDGAWFVWSTQGNEGVMVGRLDANANVVEGPQPLSVADAHVVPGTFAVERRKDALILAMATTGQGGSSRIDVTSWNSVGDIVWKLDFAAAGAIDAPITLLTAPEADAFLVVWSELPTGAAVHRLRIARIACQE